MSADKFHNRCEYKFLPFDEPAEIKHGTFKGYASLFNQVDLGNDIVDAGAFKKSLRTRGANNIRMLFQHDPSEPIGIWQSLEENHKGLLAVGQLNLDVARGKEVHSLLRTGAIDGLSIGYQINQAYEDKKTGIRHIVEADLWEISIVTFPMLPQARIENVGEASQPPNAKSSHDLAVDKMMNATLMTKLKTAKFLFKT